ncbi:hypothetical protein ACFQAT_26725 [Undibacterium arcticum]|uniref:Uncharacterized protein n=1 Tax=Undibacterium arcticum TaxID=1762892 RepID=A0ABV7F3N1_9BURK
MTLFMSQSRCGMVPAVRNFSVLPFIDCFIAEPNIGESLNWAELENSWLAKFRNHYSVSDHRSPAFFQLKPPYGIKIPPAICERGGELSAG